jgi:Holliday junction resolvasome RuvABC endonuclease subunit
MTTPTVIGVDLSFTATGIAWADGAVDVFGTDPKADDIARCQRIALDVLALTPPTADLVCIEAGVHRSSYAFRAGILHGLVRDRLATERPHTRVLLVPPGTLKMYATGKGNADKTQMVVAARDRLGYDGTNDNEADALFLRALGMALLGHPIVDLPQTHLRALEKVK